MQQWPVTHEDAEYQALGYDDALDAAREVIKLDPTYEPRNFTEEEREEWAQRLLSHAKAIGEELSYAWNKLRP